MAILRQFHRATLITRPFSGISDVRPAKLVIGTPHDDTTSSRRHVSTVYCGLHPASPVVHGSSFWSLSRHFGDGMATITPEQGDYAALRHDSKSWSSESVAHYLAAPRVSARADIQLAQPHSAGDAEPRSLMRRPDLGRPLCADAREPLRFSRMNA